MAKRIFIAWEIGGGRGHVVHLAAIAAVLHSRGFINTAYLVHMDHAAEIAPFCELVAQGPSPPYRQPSERLRPSTRYSDWLGLHSFDLPEVVRAQIKKWREILRRHPSDLVLAEQSPSAILAARSLHIPVVHVGVPVTAPPPELASYPPYLPHDIPPLYDEGALRDAVSEAIHPFGLPPLANFPGLYKADAEVVASLTLLDRYSEWRASRLVPPVVGGWVEPGERRREEVFVYLSTGDRFDPVILTAIAALDLPRRVVIAGNPAYGVRVANWRSAIVEDRPLPPEEIARRTRVMVHAGNHGTSSLGLRAGLPQVTLSYQPEHVFDGRQLAAAGVGIAVERDRWTVPNIQAAIREAWSSSSMADRATALASELSPELEGEAGELTADRIESVIHALCQ